MKNSYYLCIGCGKLHGSSECSDCFGCDKRTECLDLLNGGNKEIKGLCQVCRKKKEVIDAVAA